MRVLSPNPDFAQLSPMPVYKFLRGLPLEEALRKCSDPCDVEQCDELRGRWLRAGDAHFRAYVDARIKLEGPFVEKLSSSALLASAFQAPLDRGSWRWMVSSSLWEILRIDYEQSEATAHGLHLIQVEVYGGAAMDRAKRLAPERAPEVAAEPAIAPPMRATDEFEHSADYSRVVIRGLIYQLGPTQANVVRILHEASQTEQVWRNGKQLMDDAGSKSLKVSDTNGPHS